MKLILTRHGETEENKLGILQGQLPGMLSEKGIKQAKSLALRLKGTKIDCIYSSDLKRAVDTAKEIAVFHSKTPLRLVKSLREVDVGPFAGKKGGKIDWEKRPKGIESEENMQKRVARILKKAFKLFPKGTVLFVGHAGINKTLVRVILRLPHDEKLDAQPNATVSIFEIRKDKKHKVHLINCPKHLD